MQKKEAHLILATAVAGVCAVSSLPAAEVSRLALTLVPKNNQGKHYAQFEHEVRQTYP